MANYEIPLILGGIGIPFILAYIGVNLDKEHFFMKMFFLFISAIQLLFTSNNMVLVIQANSGTAGLVSSANGFYYFQMFLTIFLIGYMVYYFVKVRWEEISKMLKSKVGNR